MNTEKTLIRRRILRRLIWVYTVCPCPYDGALSINGLKSKEIPFIYNQNEIRLFIFELFYYQIPRHRSFLLYLFLFCLTIA